MDTERETLTSTLVRAFCKNISIQQDQKRGWSKNLWEIIQICISIYRFEKVSTSSCLISFIVLEIKIENLIMLTYEFKN